MPQYRVYRNRNAATRGRYPLLVDIQSDLLEPLASRVVIPLTPAGPARARRFETLTPACRVENRDYLLVTPQLAGISAAELGAPVGDLSAERDRIIAALDLLFTGI